MKTKIIILILLSTILYSCSSDWEQSKGVFWYLPSMNKSQAENLAQYNIIVLDYENFINNPEVIRSLRQYNPDIKIFLYLNPTEIFEPMWDDKPWSIQLLQELQERPGWWLYQPNGKKIGIWPGMKTLNMRVDAPLYEGKTYWQFIAEKFIKILDNEIITGCLIDNCWGGDASGVSWIDTQQGQEFDFSQNGIADKNYEEIDRQWAKGMENFLKAIRKAKGKNFPIVANPGNLSYLKQVDGKQFEHFPYSYHHLDGFRNDWEANIFIASQYKIAFINPDPEDYFLGLCTSVMIDNAIFFKGQNQFYKEKYDLKLGKPLRKMKNIEPGLYVRPFKHGKVFVREGNKAWIEYNSGAIKTKSSLI